jgi:uncharacterized SAM-binding protein YcdF (DUF218 family)
VLKVLAGTVAMAGVGLFLSVIRPPTADHPTGDAVVVHAGGRGERLRLALELMENEAAPTLVIMGGSVDHWPTAQRLCGQTFPFEVLCPDPLPGTTLGEARVLAALVGDRQWKTVVAVTSDYHLRRAHFLDQKCNPGVVVHGVAATSELPTLTWLARIGREMVALIEAAVTRC